MRKSVLKRLAAAVLVLAMACSFTGAAAAAGTPAPELPATDPGDVTVYVMSDASGKPEKLYLTDALAKMLPDGKPGRGLPMFDSDGVELNKPSIEDSLPIDISISYTLDGKKISPKKLAGKSGHVVIRYDYENLCRTKAMIAGEETEIYVPFAVVTGLVLDDTKFSNVEVSSGKVVSDGSRSIVAGLALPGMQENLNLDKSIIDLPEYVEISADVEDFSLAMSLSLVTNDIFGDGTDMSYNTEDIENALLQLRTAMDMLIDGATQLYGGISLLSEKSTELVDGVTQLHEGMQLLDSHSSELNDGATQVFNSLLAMANQQIAEKGLEIPQLTIENYNDVLTALIDSLSPEAMLETIKQKIIEELEPVRPEFRQTAYLLVATRLSETARQERYSAIARQVEAEQGTLAYDEAAKSVRIEVGLEVTDEMHGEIVDGLLAEYGAASYEELAPLEKAAVDAAALASMAAPGTVQEIDRRAEEKMLTDEVKARIDARVQDALALTVSLKIAEQHEQIESEVRAEVEELIQMPDYQAEIERHADDLMNEAVSKALQLELVNNIIMQQAEEGVKQLGELLVNLNAFAQFYYGLRTYTAGVSTAAEGVKTLYDNMPVLTSGVTQLDAGGKMLLDGIIRFDQEGISRITNIMDGEIGELRDRIKASYDAAKAYKGLESVSEDIPCVSFVYRSSTVG